MTISEWLIFILFVQLLHGLGTWKLYVKANRKAWEAFIPIYNGIVLLGIIKRPKWWIVLLFLPVINLIVFGSIWLGTARSFGKTKMSDTILAIISLGFYNFYLSYFIDASYDKEYKPNTQSTIESILYAIIAATIVHTYSIQPFVIPSSSLEKSLLVGDFLLVSKMHFGPRFPMTTVGAPMVHDTLPFFKIKSYLFNDHHDERETSLINKLQLPYLRIPGWDKIDRNEIVVFNQPADTLLDMNKFKPKRNYYKPIDKKTNLVKRCVGIAGDTLEIKDGYVYINGEKNKLPDRAELQFSYEITLKQGHNFTRSMVNQLKDRYDITDGIYGNNGKIIIPAASEKAIKLFRKHPSVADLSRLVSPKEKPDPELFPQDPNYNWNIDQFGPIYIPKKGNTISINSTNYPIYKRLIGEYENNKIVQRGSQIYINDKPATTYTFQQDYYWMMGDNRHNSIDARRWGFVPFDHVLGKPVFIWMSIKGINDGIKNWSIRWDRVFTTVHSDGARKSYLIHFLLLMGLVYAFNKWRKHKKNKN